MNINVYLTHSLINDEIALKDKNVVVIDVLRATTTMTIALVNGAKEIIPAESATKAARIAKGAGSALLCGERAGKIIEGFNLGNSPLEYTPEAVKDKPLVFSTTNGTVSIVKAKYAKTCVLASFINLNAVVEHLKGLSEDVVIICSGKLSNFSIEDAVCAGIIIDRLVKEFEGDKVVLNDAEQAVIGLSNYFLGGSENITSADIHKLLTSSEHGKYLASIGFADDLEICAKLDSFNALPIVVSGTVKLKESIEEEQSQKQQMRKLTINKKQEDLPQEK